MSNEQLALEILKILLDHIPEDDICVASITFAYTTILHKLEKML